MSIRDKLKHETQNLSVLYVEDENDTRAQISQILQLFFNEVFIAQDGEKALEIYQINNIDLVMTDLTMPKMDGLTLIRKIRNINHNQHIIVLTAHNSSDNLIQTIDLQLDGFLLKPIKMDKMLELLLKVTHTINLERNE